jgi:hypothetical protein
MWREIAVGRWCLMTARSVTGRCWLICAQNSVLLSANSLSGLIALAIGRGLRRTGLHI